jgi:hypothetical protein
MASIQPWHLMTLCCGIAVVVVLAVSVILLNRRRR